VVRTARRRIRGTDRSVQSDLSATRCERGQAIPEFALAAIPLFLLLLGIVQFAFIYNTQVGLTNAVRDTARFGSSLTANTDVTATTAATNTYGFLTASLGKYVAPYNAGLLVSGSGASEVCYSQHTDGNAGQNPVWVDVSATYRHPLLVPLVGAIIDAFDGASDGSFAITASTEIRVDNPLAPIPALSATACNP
jgi:Flp pilus assembly protein TadG